MPTLFLLVLSAQLVGLRIQARLTNDGDEPQTVVVGDSCAGPLFKLVVDGKPRPFVGTGRACSTPHLYSATVPAHGDYAILSDALDGRHHRIQVTLGELQSAVIEVPTVVRVDLQLAAATHAPAGKPLDVEIDHVNHSEEAVSLPTCGEDRLLIDGAEQRLDGPCADATPRMVPRRGAFVTRGRVGPLAPGRHVLRARWRDTQSDDVIVDVE